jgi:succinoglycan biosynthesis transport protein ExoP
MLQTRIPIPREADPQGSELHSLEQIFSSLYGLLKRQYSLMALILLLCIGAASLYLLTAPNRYTGTAELIIDSRKMQTFQPQSTSGADLPVDSSMVDSQVEILKSESIALSVIKDLRLIDLPEFTGSQGGLLGFVADAISSLFPEEARSDHRLLRTALKRFQSRLAIKRLQMSYVMEISYQSLSPELSARIANAVAEAYIVDSLESKYQASRRAAVWLQDRMKELRAQASSAERAVADYKAKNNIVDAGGRLLSEQQLAEMNSTLTVARATRAEAQARYDRIMAILKSDDNDRNVILNDLATVNDAMQNPVIQKLRQTYLDYAAKATDWANRYGQGHLAVVNLKNQMREIRRSLLDELRRTAESYKSDFEIAKTREENSQKNLNEAIGQSNDNSQAKIVLKDLESNAQSARALADNFLQLYMVSVQQQSFPITDARVITLASEPLEPSSPKTLLILIAAIGAGGMLALVGGHLRDASDRAFRTPAQIEKLLGVGCLASIPMVGRDRSNTKPIENKQLQKTWRSLFGTWAPPSTIAKATNGSGVDHAILLAHKGELDLENQASSTRRAIHKRSEVANTVLQAPFSRFAEGIRSIKMATDLDHLGQISKVIGITSALPNEGKSTISEALALVGAQSGSRTLLVDGDIRNPSLTRDLSPSMELGLVDLVLGKAALNDVICVDAQTGLHFLPCVVAQRFSNSSDVLGSPQMVKLFQQLRDRYERIIVDLSPLAPVIDVRATGGIVDSYVLVVEWARANVDIVDRALNETAVVRDRLLGAVLNKANISAMSRYDQQLGGYYHNDYYHRYGYHE